MTSEGEKQTNERKGEGKEAHIAPHARNHAVGIAERVPFRSAFPRKQAAHGDAHHGDEPPQQVAPNALCEIGHAPHQQGNGNVEVAPKQMEATILKVIAPTRVDNHGRDEFQTLSPGHGLFIFHGVVFYVLPTRVLRLFDVAENESTNGLQYKLYNERKNGIIANFPTF